LSVTQGLLAHRTTIWIAQCAVVRLQLPVDLLGLSVGETEDILISLCAFAKSRDDGRCVLLLDDAEHIFGQEYNGPNNSGASGGGASQSSQTKETHLQARSRSIMLSLFDTMARMNTDGNRVLIVCTANHNIGETLSRFDEIHFLAPPDEPARKQMLLSVLTSTGLFSQESWQSQGGGQMEDVLSSVVDCSVGMHYAQLSLHCRQAMLFHCNDSGALQNMNFKPIQVLYTLKQRIQTSTPSSLRSSDTGDFVDMTVLTAKDMLRPSSTSDAHSQSQGERSLDLPLFGSSAEAAWHILHRLIVLPLCCAKALDSILYGTSGQKSGFSSGVLLTGPPGCGKSSIAYAIAAAAASILPSIKLINVSCTSLVHKEVGRSEQSVHKLFECARAAAPCILVMDAIENIAAVRGNDYTTEGTMDRVLSTLLTELDGVDNENVSTQGTSTAIAIICITSNVNWIDPALRRPGRLEKVVELTRPEQDARRRIAQKEIQQSPFLPEYPASISLLEDLSQFVSEQTEGMTAAGVIALCNEAKLLCAHDEDACGSPLGDGSLPRVLCRRHFLECHGAR
jgi:SpoVK/Ycf46/Vps4 family AAA+-type ATPase